ncbi:MAG: PAS domain-containing protein [Natronomonas sp.]
MSYRSDVIECLRLPTDAFRRQAPDLLDSGLDCERLDRFPTPAAVESQPDLPDLGGRGERERDLLWRLWLLEDAPVGLTLSGPAYQDNPIVYANRTLRRMTGYSLPELRGENPRLFQGPKTEAEAVANLREAINIWEQVTVELWNYRRDGTPFRNRVSIVPMAGDSGAITNWIGVQERIE